ncbi:MAG: methyltransferase [Paludibacter sp.]|nr:methyltransferase [Paludibacter sp.]
MPNPYFKFKQFTVYHDKCAMKVGIDGVLLGAWADANNSESILDVGTGSGLIALMLAQRSEAAITAIDIVADAVIQATENIENSPWKSRIHTVQTTLQHFAGNAETKFDLIVSNPPFFINSLKAPEEKRNTARHTDTLTHEELIDNAIKLLSDNGRLSIILPVEEGTKCIEYANSKGLYCKKLVKVQPRPEKAAHRLLIEFTPVECETEISEICIENGGRGSYTEEFSRLLRDFYLKL